MRKAVYEDPSFAPEVNETPASYNSNAGSAAKEFTYDLKEHIGILSTTSKGWHKELNIVSWSGNDDKFDIRTWNAEHNRMFRGITLTESEARALGDLLTSRFRAQEQAAAAPALPSEQPSSGAFPAAEAVPSQMAENPSDDTPF